MPGDPYRAKWARNISLKDAKLVNEVAGMLGFTGHGNWQPRHEFKGSGMGMPSLSIYANELISRIQTHQNLIPGLASCGGMARQVGIRM